MDKDNLLQKWLNNDLTDAEAAELKAQDDYEFNKKIIESATQFKASEVNTVADFNTFKERYQQQQQKPAKKVRALYPILRVAAILVFAFGIYFTLFLNTTSTIITLAGEKTTIELPDASEVSLNALSSIAYTKKDWDSNRTIELSGEAFFKVAKGKKFDVVTEDGTVTVLGTQFNVKQRANYFEVVCYEGIVKVVSDTIVRQLTVGDSYRIYDGKFTEKKIAAKAPSWTQNYSSFTAVPIKEVFVELERQFDIKVSFKNTNENRLFTGGFSHENLQNALMTIAEPMNLQYELQATNSVIIYDKQP
ncbi:FecR family protein [Kordia sp. YSTF-M3]|uniref:FecR family protein n=1 Tax=Kordia aestuariivivens TaxID=2759037 RepID=A0ABR7Q914_9FLAO|nr:FecR family protein [Kordia aestuariivivens]MBC8754851.1 FecR family protein [Kordia aestuariivivens]